MARAAADVNNAAVESPSTKKDDSEAASVDEHGYATVDPVFRLPSPQGGEVFFASVPDGVQHISRMKKKYKKLNTSRGNRIPSSSLEGKRVTTTPVR